MKINKKNLWITSLQLNEIEGSNYIPTELLFNSDDNTPSLTNRYSSHELDTLHVNRNFKVELGNTRPGAKQTVKSKTNAGAEISAFELTDNFFNLLLKDIENNLGNISLEQPKLPATILVAEPLSFQIESSDSNWIANYRENIRRILNKYESVEFLPEPFAVYQYYRYGLEIPQLRDDSKHIALIIDFGGGTFDICVIESTHQGDVSLSGKHSKPLAANSIPIGGFSINTELAKFLLKRDLEGRDKKKIDNYYDNYKRVKKGELKLSSLNAEKTQFIRNFEKLEELAEGWKKQLVNKITNWKIEAENYSKIPISLPANPFTDSDWIESELYGHQLRNVFISEIWDKKLKNEVNKLLRRAESELDGKSISITLISGGSSNIQWLSELLIRDFEDQLSNARPLPLNHSFQEIVAKGLAVECARRHYDEHSEFVSVTYNSMHLILDPDGKGVQVKPFQSVENKIDMQGAKPGDLVPSAQDLRHFFEVPLQWKVKLSSFPKSYLAYYFVRSSRYDGEQELMLDDRYNVEKHKVYTIDSKRFDSQVRIEIVMREDGTVRPKFIYKMGSLEKGIEENSVLGDPFTFDMTTGSGAIGVGNKYIGIDFGTSNSSVCELSGSDISVIQSRSNDTSWLSLKDSLGSLPFPVAISVRRYLAIQNKEQSINMAREAFEAGLAFIGYLCTADVMTQKTIGDIFKQYQHRSMGPLFDLIRKTCELSASNSIFTSSVKTLFEKHKVDIKIAKEQFTEHKHEKLADSDVNAHQHLLMIVNICVQLMKNKKFGYLSDLQSVKFKRGQYSGNFKVAHDNQPFIETLKVSTTCQFSESDALLLDLESRQCLNLSPLIFWENEQSESEPMGCYFVDKHDKSDASFVVKSSTSKSSKTAKDFSPDLHELYEELYKQGTSALVEITSVEVHTD